MGEIWTMGEMLVEIMRSKVDVPFEETGVFLGPYPSGAPVIFIDTAARLGIKSGIIGGVGDDGFGRNLLERLKKDDIDCRYIQTIDGSTGVAFITYYSDGAREYIFHIVGTPAVKVKKPPKLDVGKEGFFHLMGCSLFMDPDVLYDELISTMLEFKDYGYKISFDPNIRTELLKGDELIRKVEPVMQNTSVLLPGRGELLSITGKDSIESAVDYLFSKYEIMEIIAIKLGAKGCRIISRNEDITLGALTIKEVDPTGAGDCFDAGFLSGILKDKSLRDSAVIASAAGALNASAFGPMEGEISPADIKKILAGTEFEGVEL